jgi:hypothetical protein
MRKLLLIAGLGVVLAVPAVATAVASAPNDGTLALRDVNGRARVVAVGGFIGRLERGKVTIIDPVEGDGTAPVLTGCDLSPKVKDLETGGTSSSCSGTKLRFRLVGGRFRVTIFGMGLDLSLVGRGTATLDGFGGDDGRYSLNGDEFRSMPDIQLTFPLAAPSPAAP